MLETVRPELYDRDYIRQSLREGVCDVTFIKSNGKERVMECTLKARYLPRRYLPRNDYEKIVKAAVELKESIRVWDMKKKAWRSFKFRSITNFEPL